jgi:uncharacterized membrane protein
MSALRSLSAYLLTLATFLALAAVWLGVVARDLYRRELGHLLAPTVRWGAAAVFYLIYVAAVLVLVVWPNRGAAPGRVAALGALLGLCAYAAYDLTNLATLRDWPLRVTLIDLAWGAALTALTAVAGRGFVRWLAP